MSKNYMTLMGLLMVALISTGCSKGSDTTSTSRSSAKSTASAPVVDPALAFKGEEIYNQNCIFCHQEDAIGKPGTAPSLTNKEFLSIAPLDFLTRTIENGRAGTGMPPFGHLGKDKIEAVIAFLRSHATLPDRIKEVDSQAVNQGDPRFGETWFHQICSSCHGPEGNGYAAGGTGTAIGKAGFLDTVSDGFIRVSIKEGRSNTRMRAFFGPKGLANLTDREIDDIIAYLRTVPSKN